MSIDQEQSLRILEAALWRIARSSDCERSDSDEESPSPCNCPPCAARAALQEARGWRFYGALWERTQSGHWPREVKMHAAWKKLAESSGGGPDHLLSNILREEKTPSTRDWYVATSVIQWLATNVGMTVLEAAGFSYQQWEQDRADGELFRRRQDQAKTEAEISRRREQRKPEAATTAPQQVACPANEAPNVTADEGLSGAPTADAVLEPDTWAGYNRLVSQLNALHRTLSKKPEKWKSGYSLDPGSILNAYREGDLSFDEARGILSSAQFSTACAGHRSQKPTV